MRTLIISGSARQDNNTYRVALALSKVLNDSEIIDFKDFDLPHANKGFLGKENLTTFQERLIGEIDRAELLIVLTPEYNWFPTAEIVSMIHHLASNTHGHIFDNQVVAFVGVSAGRGGRMPAIQLGYVFDKIITYLNLNSITSSHSFESHDTTMCIDQQGNLLDNERYNKEFERFVQYSVNVAERWQGNR